MLSERCADCGRKTSPRPYAKWCDACRWKHRCKPRKYTWTPERDAILRERYNSRRGTAAKIAASFGWPKWVVTKRAGQMALTTAPSHRVPWTPGEERFLSENLGERHLHWLAQRLRRPASAVALKIKRMHLSRRWRSGYTLRDLGMALGEEHRKITRWIDAGRLRAERRGASSGPRDGWHITDGAVLDFLRDHPLEVRLDRVDQLWLLDLVFSRESRKHLRREAA
jgi:hypothetical protein